MTIKYSDKINCDPVINPPVELAKELITLPSYVGDSQDEMPVIDFVEEYIRVNLPELTIERQAITAGSRRCNLIVRGKGEPNLFVLGHVDTVQPKAGWKTDPFRPVVKGGRLYGLGAADMKGSLAAFLWALVQNKQNISFNNLMLLIYVDEEYDFKGIMRFIQSRSVAKLNPALTLSLDGDLALATGCRGVIELKLTVRGKSGHASNPANGNNAIMGAVAALREVDRELGNFADPKLGSATTNIAYICGGTRQKDDGGNTVWSQEGNVIADTAEMVFEVRTPVAEVNASSVLAMIKDRLETYELTLEQATVRHDIKPWPVMYDAQSLAVLKKSYAEAGVPFVMSDRTLKGYIDAQMIAEKVLSPTFIIGTGGENQHGANECVRTKDLVAVSDIYAAIMRRYIPPKQQIEFKSTTGVI